MDSGSWTQFAVSMAGTEIQSAILGTSATGTANTPQDALNAAKDNLGTNVEKNAQTATEKAGDKNIKYDEETQHGKEHKDDTHR